MSPGDVFPPFHPMPALRLAAGLAGTVWTVGLVQKGRTPRVAAQRWALRVLRQMKVQVRLSAPLPPGAQLWVSNHLSWIDPLIYLSLRPSGALAKAEVASYPLLGGGARKIGLRFVNRDNLFSRAAALRNIAKDLHAGDPFLLFPEGTTTHGDHLAPLHEGGLRMAHRLGIKLLPLRISSREAHYPWVGDDDLLPHIARLARARCTQVAVHPGALMDPALWPNEDQWVENIRTHLEPA